MLGQQSQLEFNRLMSITVYKLSPTFHAVKNATMALATRRSKRDRFRDLLPSRVPTRGSSQVKRNASNLTLHRSLVTSL
jgi:hypothetical protein